MDKILSILIKFGLSNDAAKQAAADIQKITDNTKEAGKETGKMSSGIGELRGSIGRLTQAVPGLGIVLRAAFNPVTAIITAAVVVFRSLQSAIAAANERFDALEAKARLSTGVVEALNAATDAGAKSWAAYVVAVANATKTPDPIAEQFKARLELLKAQLEAQNKLNTALGRPTQDFDQTAINEMQNELATREQLKKSGSLQRAVANAQSSKDATGLIGGRLAEIASLEAKTAPGGATAEAARKAQEELQNQNDFLNSGQLAITPTQFGYLANPKKLEEAAESAERDLAMEKNRLKEIRKHQIEYETRIAAADADLAQAKDADVANEKRIAELRRQIPTAQAAANIRATGSGIAAVATDATKAGSGADAATIADAAAGADALKAGGKATGKQAAAIAQLVQVFNLQTQNNENILAILGRMNDSQKNFETSLRNLQGRVRTINN